MKQRIETLTVRLNGNEIKEGGNHAESIELGIRNRIGRMIRNLVYRGCPFD